MPTAREVFWRQEVVPRKTVTVIEMDQASSRGEERTNDVASYASRRVLDCVGGSRETWQDKTAFSLFHAGTQDVNFAPGGGGCKQVPQLLAESCPLKSSGCNHPAFGMPEELRS